MTRQTPKIDRRTFLQGLLGAGATVGAAAVVSPLLSAPAFIPAANLGMGVPTTRTAPKPAPSLYLYEFGKTIYDGFIAGLRGDGMDFNKP